MLQEPFHILFFWSSWERKAAGYLYLRMYIYLYQEFVPEGCSVLSIPDNFTTPGKVVCEGNTANFYNAGFWSYFHFCNFDIIKKINASFYSSQKKFLAGLGYKKSAFIILSLLYFILCFILEFQFLYLYSVQVAELTNNKQTLGNISFPLLTLITFDIPWLF